jgi:hypothetical protein
VEPGLLLSRVRKTLEEQGEVWESIAGCMPHGQVQYQPIRNNPMRSGYQFQYRQAGLNLNLFFPEKQFNHLVEILDKEKVLMLKSVFQAAIPERSGYIINEFKIRGILEGPGTDESEAE